MSSDTQRSQYQVTFAVLAVGVSAYALLQSLVLPVLPLFQEHLHTSQNTVTWVLTAYLLSASVLTPIIGRIGDMYGKKRILVLAFVAVAVGSALAALATSITIMIIARVIQGIGGGIIPLAFGIVRDEFPSDKVVGAVGMIASLLAVGTGLGLVLAGPIINVLDYHWLFWIPGFLVAGAAIATHFVVPESRVRTAGRISWLAAVLLSAWLVALLVAVSEAPDWGWGSAAVIGLVIVAVVLAGGWYVVELRSSQPLIDMRMMRLPAVWTANLVAFLFGVGMYSLFAFLPEFAQTPSGAGYGFGASVTQSGLIILPLSVMMFIAGGLSGRLSARFSARRVLIAGSVASVIPFVLLAFAHRHVWEISIATVLFGIGFGLAFSAMSGIIVDAVPSHQTGVASGMNANIRTVGGSIGAAAMASIVTAHSLPDGFPRESGYTDGFTMLAVVAALAALAALLVPNLKSHRDAHQRQQAEMAHGQMAIVAAGTVVGDESE